MSATTSTASSSIRTGVPPAATRRSSRIITHATPLRRPRLQVDLVKGTVTIVEPRKPPSKTPADGEQPVKSATVSLLDKGNVQIGPLLAEDCADATELVMNLFFKVRPQDILRKNRLKAEQSERVYQGLLDGATNAKDRLMLSAKVGGILVGVAEVSMPNGSRFGAQNLTPRAPLDQPYLSDVAVATNQRGRGIGKELTRAAEDALRRLGHGKMYLHTKVDNEAAQALFTKLGYTEPSDVKLTPLQIAQRGSKNSPFAMLGLVEVGHLLLAKDL